MMRITKYLLDDCIADSPFGWHVATKHNDFECDFDRGQHRLRKIARRFALKQRTKLQYETAALLPRSTDAESMHGQFQSPAFLACEALTDNNRFIN